MTDRKRLSSIAEWLDCSWSARQEDQFLQLADHLAGEGVVGGGIGPHEAPRMVDRHIGDSLVFLSAIDASDVSVLDVGSGIGLPGIPIAIARPDLAVTLLDRSQRRADLARRTVRVLSLDNVEVKQGDVNDAKTLQDVVVFRASLGITEAAKAFLRLTGPDGTGVFGVSRLPTEPDIPDPPDGVVFDLRREAAEVLDSPSWLLRMRRL